MCPAKSRLVAFTEEVDLILKEVCLEIAKRYEIIFIVIGIEKGHVHFLLQSVPKYSPAKRVKIVKNVTARDIQASPHSEEAMVGGGEFWTKGYFMATVGRHGDEDTLKNYGKNQGRAEKDCKKLHKQELQLELF